MVQGRNQTRATRATKRMREGITTRTTRSSTFRSVNAQEEKTKRVQRRRQQGAKAFFDASTKLDIISQQVRQAVNKNLHQLRTDVSPLNVYVLNMYQTAIRDASLSKMQKSLLVAQTDSVFSSIGSAIEVASQEACDMFCCDTRTYCSPMACCGKQMCHSCWSNVVAHDAEFRLAIIPEDNDVLQWYKKCPFCQRSCTGRQEVVVESFHCEGEVEVEDDNTVGRLRRGEQYPTVQNAHTYINTMLDNPVPPQPPFCDLSATIDDR